MKRMLLLAVVLGTIAAMRAAEPPLRPVTYGYALRGRDSLYLDRYTPQVRSAAPRPCILFLFGGGFVGGHRDDGHYLPYFRFLNDAGYEVVSMDYRLGLRGQRIDADAPPEALFQPFATTVGDAVEDVVSATAFLLGHAAEWGIDPRMIVLNGSSAGAVAALQTEYLRSNGMMGDGLPAAFHYAGIIAFAGAIFHTGPEPEWAEAPAPMLLFHGDADRNVPFDHVGVGGVGISGSAALARLFSLRGYPFYFYRVAESAHEVATTPMDECRYVILDFLHRMVAERQPLQLTTRAVRIGAPVLPKAFSWEDYLRSNYGGE